MSEDQGLGLSVDIAYVEQCNISFCMSSFTPLPICHPSSQNHLGQEMGIESRRIDRHGQLQFH